MSPMSRRDLLRVAGASAAAVPAVALTNRGVLAARTASGSAAESEADTELDAVEAAEATASGPVMVLVSDAAKGDVSILQGTSETVVRDRRLVAKIVRASGKKA